MIRAKHFLLCLAVAITPLIWLLFAGCVKEPLGPSPFRAGNGAIVGRIVDVANQPLTGVTVLVQPAGVTTVSGLDGIFRVPEIAGSSAGYNLVLIRHRYQNATVGPVPVGIAEEVVLAQPVVMQSSMVTLTGTVVATPPYGIGVTVPGQPVTALSDGTGGFVLTDVEPTATRVVAASPSVGWGEAALGTLSPGQVIPGIVVTVNHTGTGSVAGVLTDSLGSGLAKSSVGIITAVDSDTTDNSGSFGLEGCVPDGYSILQADDGCAIAAVYVGDSSAVDSFCFTAGDFFESADGAVRIADETWTVPDTSTWVTVSAIVTINNKVGRYDSVSAFKWYLSGSTAPDTVTASPNLLVNPGLDSTTIDYEVVLLDGTILPLTTRLPKSRAGASSDRHARIKMRKVSITPTVSAGPDQTVAPGTSVSFLGNAYCRIGGIRRVFWDFDGDGIADSTFPHSAAVERTFSLADTTVSVAFGAQTSFGTVAWDTLRVQLTSLVESPGVSISLPTPESYVNGLPLVLEFDVTGDSVSLDWVLLSGTTELERATGLWPISQPFFDTTARPTAEGELTLVAIAQGSGGGRATDTVRFFRDASTPLTLISNVQTEISASSAVATITGSFSDTSPGLHASLVTIAASSGDTMCGPTPLLLSPFSVRCTVFTSDTFYVRLNAVDTVGGRSTFNSKFGVTLSAVDTIPPSIRISAPVNHVAGERFSHVMNTNGDRSVTIQLVASDLAGRVTRIPTTLDWNVSGATTQSGIITPALSAQFSFTPAKGRNLVVVSAQDSAGNSASDTLAIHAYGVLFVKEGGTGDGTSWITASGDLAAVLASSSNYAADTVWVTAGTYKPNAGWFTLPPSSVVLGGFSANDSLVDQRRAFDPLNPNNPPVSVLSGDIIADGVVGPGDAPHVVVGGPSSILDGFVIEFGYNDSTSTGGGGGYNSRATGTVVSSCFFRNNRSPGGMAYNNMLGGGTIRQCRFENNGDGTLATGVVHISNNNSVTTANEVRIENCFFGPNAATGFAGLLLTSSNVVTIDGCIFSGLKSDGNGGALIIANSIAQAARLSDCQFLGNTASLSGGAILVSGGAVNFTRCSFAGNMVDTANGTAFGSAIYFQQADGEIEGCRFTGNLSGGCGGAVVIQGSFAPATLTFDSGTTTVFSNNRAGLATGSNCQPDAAGSAVYSGASSTLVGVQNVVADKTNTPPSPIFP